MPWIALSWLLKRLYAGQTRLPGSSGCATAESVCRCAGTTSSSDDDVSVVVDMRSRFIDISLAMA